jgi:hypothetical protein
MAKDKNLPGDADVIMRPSYRKGDAQPLTPEELAAIPAEVIFMLRSASDYLLTLGRDYQNEGAENLGGGIKLWLDDHHQAVTAIVHRDGTKRKK